MSNRFKDKTLRREYDSMVQAFETKHSVLFHKDGTRTNGNSWAAGFWHGFDNDLPATRFPPGPNRTILAYAHFRAGRDCAKKETK